MDGIIADLIRRRSACEQGITDQNQKIRRYEKAYESLRQFRGEESRARDSFQRINSVKLSRASELYAVSSTCRTAQLYMEGSQRTMDGIGAKIVGAAFTGLDLMVFLKLEEYKRKVRDCENRIAELQRSISMLNSMIDDAEQAADAEGGVC